jgi:hypothetical protein
MAKTDLATFLGPNKGLTVIQDRCYAYSGVGNATASVSFEGLDFTTGAELIVGRIFFSIDDDDIAQGNQYGWKIEFNGQQLTTARLQAAVAKAPYYGIMPFYEIVIPPLTRVQVTGFTNNGGVNMCMVFSGRIY